MKKALFILLLAAATGCHKSDAVSVPEQDGDRVTVGFALGQISASAKPASTRAVAEEPLAVGTTVRVLAFQRAAGAASADITADKYVAEATYVVEEITGDGGAKELRLKACNVNPTTGAVDAANTATPAEIRLRADKYDFYAFTPAAAIASPWEVSIAHGVDHASSCTADVAVAPNLAGAVPVYTQTVSLDVLMRKCAKVSFSFNRKPESNSIKKIVVKKVELSKIAHSPATSVLCETLSIGANDGSYDGFPTGTVTYPDSGDPTKFDCFDEVLPKSSGDYQLSITVNCNDADKDMELSAPISNDNPLHQSMLAFEPNKQYNFEIVLKGNIFTLILQVGDWNEIPGWGSGLGSWPEASIVVGEWTVVEKWETDLGGDLVPVVVVNGWTSNNDWSSDLGV